ncbi:MAG TPA: hypothetical protein VFR24_19935 [Candidatus Angelobacter sp.]|nr:hypothetical protein [Candidatus Angelobacter sp.]
MSLAQIWEFNSEHVLARDGLHRSGRNPAGLRAAWAATGLLKSRLFGLRLHDPFGALRWRLRQLIGTALAGFVPARRASRVDPMVALRYG